MDPELVSIAEPGVGLSELEALEIKTLLEANEIPAMVIGNSVLPNLPFDVQVPADKREAARELVREALRTFAEETPQDN